MRLSRIQSITVEYFTVSLADLIGRSRKREHVWPRHVAMYYASKLTTMTQVQIGKAFGGRDHSTVFHAIRAVEDAVETDREMREEVEAVGMLLRRQVVVEFPSRINGEMREAA